MTRVLVTGGAGFIGSHAADRLAAEGFEVRVLDDLSTGFRENLDPAWEFCPGDISQPGVADEAVAGCQRVVHLAAFTSVPDSFERFEDCYRINVQGTGRVLEACRRHRVDRLVFASSSAVYAEHPDAPRSESDCPEPVSPYAVSKLEGEHLLSLYENLHGLSCAALRFFNVYGPRQPADSDYAAAIPIFLKRCLADQSLTIYGDGRQTRDFVQVRDVAEAITRAALSSESGVFNVGTAEAIEIRTLALRIGLLTGREQPLLYEPSRPGDVQSSTADIGRIHKALGWSPGVALDDGLVETLDWWKGLKGG